MPGILALAVAAVHTQMKIQQIKRIDKSRVGHHHHYRCCISGWSSMFSSLVFVVVVVLFLLYFESPFIFIYFIFCSSVFPPPCMCSVVFLYKSAVMAFLSMNTCEEVKRKITLISTIVVCCLVSLFLLPTRLRHARMRWQCQEREGNWSSRSLSVGRFTQARHTIDAIAPNTQTRTWTL